VPTQRHSQLLNDRVHLGSVAHAIFGAEGGVALAVAEQDHPLVENLPASDGRPVGPARRDGLIGLVPACGGVLRHARGYFAVKIIQPAAPDAERDGAAGQGKVLPVTILALALSNKAGRYADAVAKARIVITVPALREGRQAQQGE